MVAPLQKTNDPAVPGTEKTNAEKQAGAAEGDACRCKEASRMTPGELLRLMMSDLAFWKKAK